MKNANIKTVEEAATRLIAGEVFIFCGGKVWFDMSLKCSSPFRHDDATLDEFFPEFKRWEMKEEIDTYTKEEIWDMYQAMLEGAKAKVKAKEYCYPNAIDFPADHRVIGDRFYLADGMLVEASPELKGCRGCILESDCLLADDKKGATGCLGMVFKEVKL